MAKKKPPEADLGAACAALVKAEIDVIQALRSRYPLDSRIRVLIEQAGRMEVDAVVTGYTGGPLGTLQVVLLGARAWTKKTTREVDLADVVNQELP
jgi:hypothetical protein